MGSWSMVGRQALRESIANKKNSLAVNASGGQWRGDGEKGDGNGQMSLWRARHRVQVVGKANAKVTGARCQERWKERFAEWFANRLA